MKEPNGDGILLIEDDPLVHEVVGKHLRNRGYKVWIADDAKTARELMEHRSEEVGLLIVDSGLPVQSGESLVAELKERFGASRVLMISGYPQRDAVYPFLQKPFSGSQLIKRVEQLMQAAKN